MATEPTPWLNEREARAWRGFHDMRTQLLSRLGRQLQTDSGLSEADFEVLVFVSEAPDQRLRAVELGRRLGWEKSRLSKQVSRMEIRGLVRREECRSGQRGAEVVLTPAGRRAIKVAAPLHAIEIRRLFVEALTPEQLDSLTEIAQAVLDNLEQVAREDASD